MLKLEGDISNTKTQTPYDYLKWAGLVGCLYSGFLFYLPLGKLFKDIITRKIIQAFSSCDFNLVEPQDFVPETTKIKDFRLCSSLKTDKGEVWYSDPIIDAKVIQNNIPESKDILWIKKYPDTSLRVTLSKLRLHSYELITMLSSTNSILPTIQKTLKNLLVNQAEILLNEKERENDFIIAVKFQDKIYKIGHCNQPSILDSYFVAGISMEKLLSIIVRINLHSDKQIEIIDKYLINTVKGVNFISNEYDIFDDRNCSVKDKQIRAKALGTKQVYILKNNRKIQDKNEIKQIGF
jgi:hypothetical protein